MHRCLQTTIDYCGIAHHCHNSIAGLLIKVVFHFRLIEKKFSLIEKKIFVLWEYIFKENHRKANPSKFQAFVTVSSDNCHVTIPCENSVKNAWCKF